MARSWLWQVADKWSIVPLREEVYGKVCQDKSPSCDEAEIDWEFANMSSYWFSHEEWIISLTSLAESEIWYEVVFAFLLSNSFKQPESPFLSREWYPLPRATQTVMRSFRLACQVQCNWLGRLKRRYHSALLIRMWRGSHVPQFISTSADSLGMADFL